MRKVNYIFVHSAWIEAIGWVDNMLYVRYLNGTRTMYSDVSQKVFEGMLSAPSPGSYFHQHIRGAYDALAPDDDSQGIIGV